VDLIGRQQHAAQTAGEQVTWYGGRRIAYLTMFMMMEFVTIFEEPSPPVVPLSNRPSRS
jgi:hypothetical protein